MLGGKELMADVDFNIYPRFYETTDGNSPFKVYSFADVLDQTESISQFRDKIVLIGLTSPRLASFQVTPDGNSISQTLAAAHTT